MLQAVYYDDPNPVLLPDPSILLFPSLVWSCLTSSRSPALSSFLPGMEFYYSTEETTMLFQDNVFKRYGLPTKVVSNRGPQFAAKFTRELWKGMGITPALSMAYHPQTDGETERVNQEIKQFL